MEYKEVARGAPLSGGGSRGVPLNTMAGSPPHLQQAQGSDDSPGASPPSGILGRGPSGSPSGEPAGGSPRRPLAGLPFESPLLADGGGHSRNCFICLEGPRRGRKGGPPKLLHPCCSQCYAVVHEKCWTAFRRRQRLASFRARLLGHRTPDTAKCSICRTGRGGLPSGVSPEGGAPQPAGDGASVLQEQLLATLGRLLMEDEDIQGQPFCSGLCLCVNALLLLAVFIAACLLVTFSGLRIVSVFLLSLFGYYHFILFQLIFLAVKQRREAVACLPLPPPPPPPSAERDSQGSPGGSSPSPGNGRVVPVEVGASSSSRARPGSPQQDAPRAPSGGPQRPRMHREETPAEEQQQRSGGGWFSFLRRENAATTRAMPASAAAPFLPDAALVLEMQVLRSSSLPL